MRCQQFNIIKLLFLFTKQETKRHTLPWFLWEKSAVRRASIQLLPPQMIHFWISTLVIIITFHWPALVTWPISAARYSGSAERCLDSGPVSIKVLWLHHDPVYLQPSPQLAFFSLYYLEADLWSSWDWDVPAAHQKRFVMHVDAREIS